jgi:hypothetical protein
MMYNKFMDDTNMLDPLYLFQPRGPGTAWLFRMPTPASLIGHINPRTGKPYAGFSETCRACISMRDELDVLA